MKKVGGFEMERFENYMRQKEAAGATPKELEALERKFLDEFGSLVESHQDIKPNFKSIEELKRFLNK